MAMTRKKGNALVGEPKGLVAASIVALCTPWAGKIWNILLPKVGAPHIQWWTEKAMALLQGPEVREQNDHHVQQAWNEGLAPSIREIMAKNLYIWVGTCGRQVVLNVIGQNWSIINVLKIMTKANLEEMTCSLYFIQISLYLSRLQLGFIAPFL